MKITFECDLKEIVEAAIICQEQYEKSEQSAQKESPNHIIAAILAGMTEFAENQQKECE